MQLKEGYDESEARRLIQQLYHSSHEAASGTSYPPGTGTMDKVLTGVVAVAQFTWSTTTFITSSVYATVLFPFKLIVSSVWWITTPARLVFGFIWTTFISAVAWFLDEFEALVIFLAVAIFIGTLGGLICRVITTIIGCIIDPNTYENAPTPKKETQNDSQAFYTEQASLDSDFSYSEDDPLPPYRHSRGTGSQRPPGSLFEQTIHEELEDSSSS
ncbi:hypothetical protein B0T16DRAFT_92112 [Cercophora newfieldiana]|uniref:Transmembrane protein n=1 Tax=Cercophora newfieldiana TaxID=92897 RepID=A0AA40CWQ5_9PEZI|nr:hypothetical protein B0T16DRAFT_92112 [Cercophora newfieldiana]